MRLRAVDGVRSTRGPPSLRRCSHCPKGETSPELRSLCACPRSLWIVLETARPADSREGGPRRGLHNLYMWFLRGLRLGLVVDGAASLVVGIVGETVTVVVDPVLALGVGLVVVAGGSAARVVAIGLAVAIVVDAV